MRSSREKALILKFGGSSSTTMDGANPEYFLPFFDEVKDALTKHYARLALVIGGGARIRALQKGIESDAQKDAIAIQALRDHASQLGTFARESGLSVSSHIPHNEHHAREVIAQDDATAVVLGGLKVGQSTDTVAVTAAEIFRDQGYDAMVIILSNVWRIFTADPKVVPDARPIRKAALDQLVHDGVLLNDPALFRSGMSVTVDPVAVSKLQHRGTGPFIPVWFGHGQDRENVLHTVRSQEPTNGTQIVESAKETEYYEAS